jgi:hypothetical protein
MINLRLAAVTTAVIVLSACSSTGPRVAANSSDGAKDATAGCVQTGSLVKRDPGKCIGFGRSYSADEMRAFGATSVADGLRNTVPGLTVSH